jgi:acyl carrier protein
MGGEGTSGRTMSDLATITEVFRVALDLPSSYVLTDESAFEDVPGWDSVGHMRIVLELERIIGAPLELDEIVGLDTVAKVRALVAAKSG